MSPTVLLDRFLRFAGVSPARPSAGVFGGTAAAAGVAAASSKKSTADARAFFFEAAGVTGSAFAGVAAAAGASEDSAAAASEARAFLRFSFFAGVAPSELAAGAGWEVEGVGSAVA